MRYAPPVQLRVLYFAVFRERLGRDHETIELADGDVAALIAALEERHPPIRALRGRYRVAVNQAMVGPEERLADGDEIALIPPVAGGASHVRLLAEPLSLDRCVAAVASPACGGIVTFTGLVRDHSHGERIVRLEYEAYPSMACAVMGRLCAAIEAASPGVRLAVEHRTGTLAVGDIAVVIAAAAPHRAEAFAACRALIDQLKDEVPIWKKEFGESGAEWVGLGP
jgi:molybdopterin synthase catalytic subunit